MIQKQGSGMVYEITLSETWVSRGIARIVLSAQDPH